MGRVGVVALLAGLMCTVGCEKVGQYGARPVTFPAHAYAGETVSLAIDATSAPFEFYKSFDLSTENLSIRLEEMSTGLLVDVPIKAVVSSMADPASQRARSQPGTEVQIALFDVPLTLPFAAYPTTVQVIPLDETLAPIYGDPASTGVYAQLEILSDSGGDGPTNWWPNGVLGDLEPLPSLRLRGILPHFDPTWVIGSVQLDLTMPPIASNPDAFAKAEAAGAAVLTADQGAGVLRVVLVHPSGFVLPDVNNAAGPLGRGPFLDVTFDKSGPFDESDFAISNLYVTDPDGNVLIDNPGPSDTFFDRIPRRNQ